MATTYTLTVNIEAKDTVTYDENHVQTGTSTAGHMWYSISDGVNSPSDYGFAPKNRGQVMNFHF